MREQCHLWFKTGLSAAWWEAIIWTNACLLLNGRHGLQLAGITVLWLAGLYIGWDCLSHNGFWTRVIDGNFYCFSEAADSLLPILTAGKLPAVRDGQVDCESEKCNLLWWLNVETGVLRRSQFSSFRTFKVGRFTNIVKHLPSIKMSY